MQGHPTLHGLLNVSLEPILFLLQHGFDESLDLLDHDPVQSLWPFNFGEPGLKFLSVEVQVLEKEMEFVDGVEVDGLVKVVDDEGDDVSDAVELGGLDRGGCTLMHSSSSDRSIINILYLFLTYSL